MARGTTLDDVLTSYGFDREDMGGNTSAYTRMNGTAEEVITIEDAQAPEHWEDGPVTLTINGYGEPREYTYADAIALVDMLDANDGNTPTED